MFPKTGYKHANHQRKKTADNMQPRKLTPEQRSHYMAAIYSCLTYHNAPYLAPLLVKLTPLSLPGLGTLASDARGHVFIDFDFLQREEIGVEDFGRLLQHESWHVINGHSLISDYSASYDETQVNIAMDLEINQHIPHIKKGWTGKASCLPKVGIFSAFPEHLTWRQYLEMLNKKRNSASSIKEKTHGKLNTCGRTKISEDLLKVAKKLDPGFEEGSMEQTAAFREVAVRLNDYAKQNPAWGQSHLELVGWANQLLAPSIVPWKRRLSRVLGTKIGDSRPRFDYTWRKPSRRQSYGVGKPYYPAFRDDKSFEPNIVIGIDVSGSMLAGNTLNHVAGEIDAILHAHTISSAYAFFVDVETEELQQADKGAKIIQAGNTSLMKFSHVKSIFKYLYSGGGTDMSKALIAASELKGKLRPDIFILVTDCETPWLTEEPAGLKRVENIILAVNIDISPTDSSEAVCNRYQIPQWLSKAVIPIPAEE